MVMMDGEVVSQAEFGELVGISQQAVSALLVAGVLQVGDSWHDWLRDYIARLSEQASGRLSADGSLDLVHERAALARSQREAWDMRNAEARSQYAPAAVLADVLAMASAAVSDRMGDLDAAVLAACPDLPPEAHAAVCQVIASARAEWLRSTASLDAALTAAEEAEADEVPDEPPAV